MKNIIIVALCVFLFSCQNSNHEKQRKDENRILKFSIAYNVLVNGENDDYDIWTVNTENGEKTNVTNNPDVAFL